MEINKRKIRGEKKNIPLNIRDLIITERETIEITRKWVS